MIFPLDNIIDYLIASASDNNIKDKGNDNVNGTEVETENEIGTQPSIVLNVIMDSNINDKIKYCSLEKGI